MKQVSQIRKLIQKYSLNEIFQHFLKGLFLVTPLVLTLYIISIAIAKIDRLIPLGFYFPGLGLLIAFLTISIIGYIGSNFIFKSSINAIEKLISRLPLISSIYNSFKEFTSAFSGEKKQFQNPVLVNTGEDPLIQRLGFITQDDLSQMNLPGKAAVYVPRPYTFSGDLYIICKKNIIPLSIPSAEAMKFVLSGGITNSKPTTDINTQAKHLSENKTIQEET